jgi:hypothetical protein
MRALTEDRSKFKRLLDGNIVKDIVSFFAVDVEFDSGPTLVGERKYTPEEIQEIYMIRCTFKTSEKKNSLSGANEDVFEIVLEDEAHYSRKTDDLVSKLHQFDNLIAGDSQGYCFFYAASSVDQIYLNVVDKFSYEQTQKRIFSGLKFYDAYSHVARDILVAKSGDTDKIYIPDLTMKTIGIHFSKDGDGSTPLPFKISSRSAMTTSKCCNGDVYTLVLFLGAVKWTSEPEEKKVGGKRRRSS